MKESNQDPDSKKVIAQWLKQFIKDREGLDMDESYSLQKAAELIALLPDVREQEKDRILDKIDEISNDGEFFLTPKEIRQALKE